MWGRGRYPQEGVLPCVGVGVRSDEQTGEKDPNENDRLKQVSILLVPFLYYRPLVVSSLSVSRH